MNTKKSLLVLLLSLVLCVTALGVNIFAEEGGADTTVVDIPISGVSLSKENSVKSPLIPLGQNTIPKHGVYKVDITYKTAADTSSNDKKNVRMGIQVSQDGDANVDTCFLAQQHTTAGVEKTLTVYAIIPAGQPTMRFYEFAVSANAAGWSVTPSNIKFTLVKEFVSETTEIFIPKIDMISAENNGGEAKTLTSISFIHSSNGSYYPVNSSTVSTKNWDTSKPITNEAGESLVNAFVAHSGTTTSTGFGVPFAQTDTAAGGVHFLKNDELRFQFNAPASGDYVIWAPYCQNTASTQLSWKTRTPVGDGWSAWSTPVINTLSNSITGNTVNMSATQYGTLATLHLEKGINNISVTSLTDKFILSAMAFELLPISYTGLSVRTEQDFAGLRSVYTVDRAMIEKLEGEGKKITFGVLAAGVTKTDGTTLTPDMTIAVDGTGKITSNGAKMVIVHDSTGANTASNTYTNAEKTEFAYTVAYFNDEQTSAYLQTAKLTFRAFYVVDGVITYVDMQGQTFGTQASLYDVATAWKDDASLTDKRAIYNILQKVDGTAFEGFDELHTVTFTDADGIVSQQKLYNGEDAFVSDFMLNGYKALTPVQIEEITAVTGDVTITLTKKES